MDDNKSKDTKEEDAIAGGKVIARDLIKDGVLEQRTSQFQQDFIG